MLPPDTITRTSFLRNALTPTEAFELEIWGASTQGVSKNKGVAALFEESLGERMSIPEEPQLVGALGAALIAMHETI